MRGGGWSEDGGRDGRMSDSLPSFYFPHPPGKYCGDVLALLVEEVVVQLSCLSCVSYLLIIG